MGPVTQDAGEDVDRVFMTWAARINRGALEGRRWPQRARLRVRSSMASEGAPASKVVDGLPHIAFGLWKQARTHVVTNGDASPQTLHHMFANKQAHARVHTQWQSPVCLSLLFSLVSLLFSLVSCLPLTSLPSSLSSLLSSLLFTSHPPSHPLPSGCQQEQPVGARRGEGEDTTLESGRRACTGALTLRIASKTDQQQQNRPTKQTLTLRSASKTASRSVTPICSSCAT